MSSLNENPPQWMAEYAQDCRALLGIGDDWQVFIRQKSMPDDLDGRARVDSEYLTAHIEIAYDVQNDEKGRQLILHEMMHVALWPVTHVAAYIYKMVSEDMRQLAEVMIDEAIEQFIQRLTRAMMQTVKPTEGADG